MAVDLVIKNCRLVSPDGIAPEGVACDGGRIVVIGSDEYLPEGRKTIDARGKYLLPGVIDTHVHIGVYHTFKEEMKDTIGAAFGGVTTIGNYLGIGAESQKESYELSFDRWKETWERDGLVDGFFHSMIISEANMKEIRLNAKRYGIASHKFLMAYKGPEGEQIGAAPADDGLLWFGFKEVASLGYPGLAQVHAENIDIIYRIKPGIQATGRQDLAAWDEARPGFCETLDAERAISIARVTGAPLYIVHVSYADTVDVIAKAKSEGVNVLAETCPQYLVLSGKPGLGVVAKINPPIRKDVASAERLWRGLREGSIDCMGTDHCSPGAEVKKELWGASPGTPGVEQFLPLMLSEGVNKGRITLEKLVEILCQNNAKAFGMYPKKGAIKVGSDADMVVVDLEKRVKLTVNKEHQVCDFIPYEGMEVQGWPVTTILRGNVLVDDGKLVAKPGIGKYIPRFVGS